MKHIVLLGAGGKMGLRLTDNLLRRRTTPSVTSRSASGAAKPSPPKASPPVPLDEALPGAEAVILAVPDNRIGQVAHQIHEKLDPGPCSSAWTPPRLTPGELPARADLSYFVTHPCHPPVVGDETTREAQFDFFGGVHAKQHIVCALQQGPESAYADGEAIARAIYAPVMDSHRVTVEQMAILEPVLSETIAASCIGMIHEATEEAVRRGVPRKAAVDFVLGHLKVEIGIYFQMFEGAKFSDGAIKAIQKAQSTLFQPDWKKVFDKEAIDQSIADITRTE
jgi:D-apionate oxidoisomerase